MQRSMHQAIRRAALPAVVLLSLAAAADCALADETPSAAPAKTPVAPARALRLDKDFEKNCQSESCIDISIV